MRTPLSLIRYIAFLKKDKFCKKSENELVTSKKPYQNLFSVIISFIPVKENDQNPVTFVLKRYALCINGFKDLITLGRKISLPSIG
jgi:hypothetical protein